MQKYMPIIHKYSWGLAWALFGFATLGIAQIPYYNWALGLAFLIAGISYIII